MSICSTITVPEKCKSTFIDNAKFIFVPLNQDESCIIITELANWEIFNNLTLNNIYF